MKNSKLIAVIAAWGGAIWNTHPAQGALMFTTSDSINYSASAAGLGQVIPDNTPVGVGYLLNFGDGGLNISSISVTLSVSGGYNGDLYAYLSHGSQIAYLLNTTPAVSGSGLNITLIEGTGASIPTGGSGVLSGSYTAYSNLATFDGTDPSGAWTLFFADLSPGDTSTLNGFNVSLATTAVPEPANTALAIFGTCVIAGGVVWRRRKAVRDLGRDNRGD